MLVISQNVKRIKDEVKLETIIHNIINKRKVCTYCAHATWLEGEFEQQLNIE
jgi:hypothetical protein